MSPPLEGRGRGKDPWFKWGYGPFCSNVHEEVNRPVDRPVDQFSDQARTSLPTRGFSPFLPELARLRASRRVSLAENWVTGPETGSKQAHRARET